MFQAHFWAAAFKHEYISFKLIQVFHNNSKTVCPFIQQSKYFRNFPQK